MLKKMLLLLLYLSKKCLLNDEILLNDREKMPYQELPILYNSLFDETRVAKLDNAEVSQKISKLKEEIESLRLVRTILREKVVFLEA